MRTRSDEDFHRKKEKKRRKRRSLLEAIRAEHVHGSRSLDVELSCLAGDAVRGADGGRSDAAGGARKCTKGNTTRRALHGVYLDG